MTSALFYVVRYSTRKFTDVNLHYKTWRACSIISKEKKFETITPIHSNKMNKNIPRFTTNIPPFDTNAPPLAEEYDTLTTCIRVLVLSLPSLLHDSPTTTITRVNIWYHMCSGISSGCNPYVADNSIECGRRLN